MVIGWWLVWEYIYSPISWGIYLGISHLEFHLHPFTLLFYRGVSNFMPFLFGIIVGFTLAKSLSSQHENSGTLEFLCPLLCCSSLSVVNKWNRRRFSTNTRLWNCIATSYMTSYITISYITISTILSTMKLFNDQQSKEISARPSPWCSPCLI
jgi:hypothetical protein